MLEEGGSGRKTPKRGLEGVDQGGERRGEKEKIGACGGQGGGGWVWGGVIDKERQPLYRQKDRLLFILTCPAAT